MSSHRLTTARARRSRLLLSALDERIVPAVFDFTGDDPSLDPRGASTRVAAALGGLPDEPNVVRLFPGGVYIFDNTTTSSGLALGAVSPTSTKTSTTATFLTIEGNGATLRRAATSPDPATPGKTVPTKAFAFLSLNGDATGYGVARINNLTFDNGQSTSSGGAVQVNGTPVVFSGVRFTNNKAAADGGAVTFAPNATAVWQSRFDNCLFADNTAGKDGGAVALSTGGSYQVINNPTYVFTQTQFTNNTAGVNGGGVSARDDEFHISGSSLAGNTAGLYGGGVYVNSDRFRTTGVSEDHGNSVGYLGNTTVDGNKAVAGGGLYVDGGWTDVRLFNCTVTSNSATGSAQDGSPGAGGIQWQANKADPDDFLATPRRLNNTYTRVELAFTVVDGNTSAAAATAADLQGKFYDPVRQTRNQLAVPNPSLGYGRNYIGVPDGITAGDVNQNRNGAALLGPLQDNGGGLLTRVPQPGSGLIAGTGRNALYPQLLADPTTPAVYDNRGVGYNRATGNLDIGAVEVQPAGTVALVQVAGDNQATALRSAFATPLTVRTLDEYGNPRAGQTVFTQPNPAGAGATFPFGTGVTTDADGFATLYPVANKTAGAYQQRVSIGQSFVDFNLTNRSRLNFVDFATTPVLDENGQPVFNPDGTPATTDVSGFGQSATVGADYGSPLQLLVTKQAFDSKGNPILDSKGNVTYVGLGGVQVSFLVTSSGDNPLINPSVALTPLVGPPTGTAQDGRYVTVTTDATGLASVTAQAGTKAGTVTVLASAFGTDPSGVPVAAGAITFILTNVAGPTTTLTFVRVGGVPDAAAAGSGQQALVGNLFEKQLAVLAGDQFGNPAPGVLVTFTSDPANPSGASFPNGPTATTVADGIARVTAAAAGKAGTFAVTATAAGLSPQTFTLTNLPGLPVGLTVVGGNNQAATVTDPAVGSGTAGAFPLPLVVEARDAGGNLVPNATITFQGPGIGAGARFEPVSATTGADGRAAVFVVPNSASGSYSVTAQVQTGNNTFAGTTFTLTNTPGPAAAVDVVAGGGQTAQAGSGFGQPVVVRVLDRFQNPVPGVTPVVTSPGATFVVTATGPDGLSQVTATAGDTAGPTAATVRVGTLPAATVPLTVTGLPPGPPVPPVGLPTLTAVGLDGGIASRVTVYNADGGIRTQFAPFDPGFLGGSRVAIARVPAPAAPTVVVVPGPGRFPDAQVFSANDGSRLATYQPFEQTFTGGVFVSTADVDRDGWEDYVLSPDQGGGPRVQIRSGRTGAVLQDFFGIEDPNFRGGARTAMGDVNGDGVPDLIVAAGFGGGPRIAVYDGRSLTGFRATPVKLFGDFFAFESTLRNGAYVAAGDVTGDGIADVVLGGGPGGGPRVRVLNGSELLAGRQTVVSDFFAGPSTDRGGVKVTVRELDENPAVAGSKGDIVTASGTGDGSRVSVYLGRDLRVGQPIAARGFDDLAGFRGGVFVG